MGGRPCIRGLRITVRRVLEILGTYPDHQELFRDYPDLQEKDLRQALALGGGVRIPLTRAASHASILACDCEGAFAAYHLPDM